MNVNRNCENCIHHQLEYYCTCDDKEIWGCELWECHYESEEEITDTAEEFENENYPNVD